MDTQGNAGWRGRAEGAGMGSGAQQRHGPPAAPVAGSNETPSILITQITSYSPLRSTAWHSGKSTVSGARSHGRGTKLPPAGSVTSAEKYNLSTPELLHRKKGM